MDEFLILLQAKLDEARSQSNINADIDKIQSQIDKLKLQVEIDPKTIANLTKQLEGILNQKIIIDNIGINTTSGIKAGQDYAKQFGQGVSQGIKNNTSILNSFKKSLEKIGMGSKEIDTVANKINSLGVRIETLNQTKSSGKKDVLSVNIAGIDQYGQAIKLTQQYKASTGELINTINNVSTVHQKAGASVDTFVEKQSVAVNNLTNQINQLNRASTDQNATRPITDASHLTSLSNAYNEIIAGIERMKNASSDNFIEEQNNVKTLISNYKSLVSEFRNAENIATQMKSTDVSSGITQAQERLGKLKANSSGFEQMVQTIRDLDVAIENVGDKSSLDKFLDDLRVAESQLSRVKAEAKELSKIEDIKFSIDNGKGASEYQNRINSVIASLEKYGVEAQEAKKITASLQSTFDNMKGMSDQELISQANKLEQEFKSVKASVEQAKLAYDKYTQPVTNEKATSLINKINTFLTKNTRITKEAKEELKGYIDELNNGVNLNRWNEINNAFKNTENSMRGLHRLGASIKDQISQAAQSFTQWLSVTSIIMTLVYQLQKIPKEVIKVNSAMVELNKVSDASTSEIKNYFDEAANSAKKYGSSVSDMITATADWSRLGYSLPDAKKLAEVATLYKNVGDGINIDTANEHLISTLQGFQLEAEDAIWIIDRFNEVNLLAS